MNDASPKPPPARGVSPTTLVLAVALAIALTAAVVLAVLFALGGARPAGPGAPAQPSVFAAMTGSPPAPFVQTDTVKPQGKTTGEVFYSIPYAAPPHLTLTAAHRPYTVVKQDEYGFSWAADNLVEDFIGDTAEITTAIHNGTLNDLLFSGKLQRKPNAEYEDFTWEAKGVPAGAGADFQRPFEQSGSFQTVIGTQGQVNFPLPYASPPNVTLSGATHTTVLVECTETGFKWKNAGTDAFFNSGSETWTAKGIRATKLTK